MGKRALVLGTVLGVAAMVYACGGGTSDIDGGVDSGNGGDSAGNDSGSGNDSSGNDTGTGTDGGSNDAGCASFLGDCDAGCPSNSVCVTKTMGLGESHQCYPLPSGGCGMQTDCQCIGACACGKVSSCMPQQPSGIFCTGGAVSRREFKTDIDYVDDAERASLADQALSTRLAEYRYKTEPDGTKRHLGFIIDDMPNQSPAVQADETHVDLYGYTSMLLATVQEQQRQIDDLKKQVDALKRK